MKYEGEIPNRRIKRVEFEDLLSGFWEYWLLKASRGDTKESIDEALYQYLLTRNEGVEANAIEDGYNIQDACGRFQHLFHVSLFSSALAGDVDDSVFVNWIALQVSLTEKLKEACNSDNEVLYMYVQVEAQSKLQPHFKFRGQCSGPNSFFFDTLLECMYLIVHACIV